jgi:hypothetical protein
LNAGFVRHVIAAEAVGVFLTGRLLVLPGLAETGQDHRNEERARSDQIFHVQFPSKTSLFVTQEHGKPAACSAQNIQMQRNRGRRAFFALWKLDLDAA